MPKVKLIHFTGKGTSDETWYAARLLAFTKNTRLEMNPKGFEEFMSKSESEIEKEIAYMSTTIPSSWEFADLVFMMTDVSRATAQQVTRSRNASFAMQSQRVTDMSSVTFTNPFNEDAPNCLSSHFEDVMYGQIAYYGNMIDLGATLEDARDVLPMGVHCNLIGKYNLRALSDLVRARKSLRVQGPYLSIIDQMEKCVTDVWPWSKPFFRPKNEVAVNLIEQVAKDLSEGGAMYKGHSGKLAKAADLIK